MPALLNADDMVLLSTSAAGLQVQLCLLERYCEEWGLTVNVDKTKVTLLAGESVRSSDRCRSGRSSDKFHKR